MRLSWRHIESVQTKNDPIRWKSFNHAVGMTVGEDLARNVENKPDKNCSIIDAGKFGKFEFADDVLKFAKRI